MDSSELLNNLRSRLEPVFGRRLRNVVLYGSAARGEDAPDSDIDILVVLEEPVHFAADLSTITRALYSLQLDMADRPLHAIPVPASDYKAGTFALYRNAQREGIAG